MKVTNGRQLVALLRHSEILVSHCSAQPHSSTLDLIQPLDRLLKSFLHLLFTIGHYSDSPNECAIGTPVFDVASSTSAPSTSSSPASVSKLAGAPIAVSATPFSTCTPNPTQSASPSSAATPTPSISQGRWESKSVRRWLNCVVTIFLGLLGVFAAYIALSLALWTSMKDYREDCRSQNSTNEALSTD